MIPNYSRASSMPHIPIPNKTSTPITIQLSHTFVPEYNPYAFHSHIHCFCIMGPKRRSGARPPHPSYYYYYCHPTSTDVSFQTFTQLQKLLYVQNVNSSFVFYLLSYMLHIIKPISHITLTPKFSALIQKHRFPSLVLSYFAINID